MKTLITEATCGPACWHAKEDECRCSCGGKNHGCLRKEGAEQPQRECRINGTRYVLQAVGWHGNITKQATEMNKEAGCYHWPIAHGSAELPDTVAKVRTPTAGQLEKWPELAGFRSAEARITNPPGLLWKVKVEA